MYSLPASEINKRRKRRLNRLVNLEVEAKSEWDRHMKAKYGHILCGLRRGIWHDRPPGVYPVLRLEVMRYCRMAQFNCDSDALWRVMDRDTSGFLMLEELCPTIAEVLATFRNWAVTKFGSCTACFRAFDKGNLKKLSRPVFRRSSARFGLTEDHGGDFVNDVFVYLDLYQG